ncbi:MAG: TetR/AcrR family transcriptional regulator [Sphingomonadales bacterium]|nr:TetR/AcrR family transcriptional regulator [Sphingomonadales bacterium]
MARKRLPGEERRAQIVAAARQVFSQHGYDGAKTLQIARAAKVSEALVYRHFPSKLALYRAVLRQVFLEQDESLRELGIHEAGTGGLIRSIHAFMRSVTGTGDETDRDRHRMTLASLAGDGSYASLIYRRSQRRGRKAIAASHAAARAECDMAGVELDPDATAMFIEHVGTMIGAITALPAQAWPYGIGGEELARQATWFCCRGIGLSDAAIARHLRA